MGRTSCLLVASLLGFLAAEAQAQPWETSASRYGELETLVATEAGGSQRLLLAGVVMRSGLLLDRHTGLAWQIPLMFSQGERQASAVGNPALELLVVPYRRLDAPRARLWLAGGASLALAPGSVRDRDTAAAFARFWARDPTLYHPDAHSARATAAIDLAGDRYVLALALRGEYWFGEVDEVFRLHGSAFGRVLLGPATFFASLESGWMPAPPGGGERFAHGAEVGGGMAGPSGGRLELYAYAPFAEDLGGALGAFGGGVRATGTF